MHSFATFAHGVKAGLQRVKALHDKARMLSYLPLSHVAERTLVEHGLLATSMRVFFAESMDTFAADLQRARPTAFFSVPRLWVKFQQGVHAKVPPAKLQRLLKVPLLGRLVRRKILRAPVRLVIEFITTFYMAAWWRLKAEAGWAQQGSLGLHAKI